MSDDPVNGRAAYGSKEWFEHKFSDIDDLGDKWGHRFRATQQYRLDRLLSAIEPWLAAPPAKTMLDIGCGVGDFLSAIHQRHPEHVLYGTDISEAATAFATRQFGFAKFKQGALPLLAYDDASFDVVSALEIVHYLDEAGRKQALSSIARVLKPGGVFLFSGTINAGERYFSQAQVEALFIAEFRVLQTTYLHQRLYGMFEPALYGLVSLQRAYAANDQVAIAQLPLPRWVLDGLVSPSFASIGRRVLPLFTPSIARALKARGPVELCEHVATKLGSQMRSNMVVVAAKI